MKMQRIITSLLTLAAVAGMGLNQAKADSKEFTKANLEKATAKTGFDADLGHGGYGGSYGSHYCGSYCSPCYSYCSPCYSYCEPCTNYCSPYCSSYNYRYNHYYHRGRR
jgi:hypothetical protein